MYLQLITLIKPYSIFYMANEGREGVDASGRLWMTCSINRTLHQLGAWGPRSSRAVSLSLWPRLWLSRRRRHGWDSPALVVVGLESPLLVLQSPSWGGDFPSLSSYSLFVVVLPRCRRNFSLLRLPSFAAAFPSFAPSFPHPPPSFSPSFADALPRPSLPRFPLHRLAFSPPSCPRFLLLRRLVGENEPRQTSWLAFRNSPLGLPLLPFPVPPSSESKPPTSLWKGEGRLQQQPRL
jgi:hypothetical protein